MKRSVSFYRDVIGLPLKFESPGWTEFATDGATLALHASERHQLGDARSGARLLRGAAVRGSAFRTSMNSTHGWS